MADERHAQPDTASLPDPVVGDPRLDQLFDGDGLYALRSAVAAHASELGLPEQDIADLVLVAHELATNAVRHGGASPARPGRLRLWAGGHRVVCEVSDPGPGPADPDGVGRTPVEPAANNGRGLWIVRQLAETLTITTADHGTTVTVALPVRMSTLD
jgi:anti-sigma regulatory factor (Ser/Thr protein kinase)